MQDITPAAQPKPLTEASPAIDSVPVKRPAPSSVLAQPADNPIATDARTMAQFASEKEMDEILEDINEKVKASSSPQPSGSGLLGIFKRASKEPKHKKPTQPDSKVDKSQSPPTKRRLLPVAVVAVIVGLALSFFAFTAFSGQTTSSPTNSGGNETDSTAASGTSLTPGDLDKLSTDIQTKLEALAKDQEFGSGDLSDSSLGL